MPPHKTCIVTGASGFIGQHFVEALVDHGHTVIGVGRNKPSCSPAHKWITADLAASIVPEEISEWSGNVDYFCHLASNMIDTTDIFKISSMWRSELINPIKLIDLLKPKGACLFSSVAVYGSPEYRITEGSLITPTGLYGTNKAILEEEFKYLGRQFNIPISILRISSVYGPGMQDSRAIPKFTRAMICGDPITIKGDPHSKRDYVFVKDVVDVCINGMNNMYNGTINIASGDGRSLIDLVDVIGRMIGHPVTPNIVHTSKANNQDISIEKARAELGFTPTTFFKGISETLRWLEVTT